jgi:hypothetical protein
MWTATSIINNEAAKESVGDITYVEMILPSLNMCQDVPCN